MATLPNIHGDQPGKASMNVTMAVPLAKLHDASTSTNSPLTIIDLGGDKREYHIHTFILINYSTYFKACMKPALTDTQTITIDFAYKEQEDAFDQLVHWFYEGTDTAIYKRTKSRALLGQIIEFYNVANRFGVLGLKHQIVNYVYDWFLNVGGRVQPAHLMLLSKLGLVWSPLGRMLVGQFAVLYQCQYELWDGESGDAACWLRHRNLERLCVEARDAAVAVMKWLVDNPRSEPPWILM